MSLYLSADCAFGFLIKNQIFTCTDWKNTHLETSKYYVSFICEYDNPKVCNFEIVVIKGQHCLLSKSLQSTAVRLGFYNKIGNIFTTCAFTT